MAKIRIKSLPKALSGLEIKMRPGLYGTNGNRQFSLPTQIDSQKYAEPDVKVGGVLGPVPREEANLEAERGETAVLNVGGIPAHFTIGGKRHSEGGTPLNLPDNSFIFSDTAKMKIKDPQILAQFGMSMKKGGYTPADIAKKYDINKFRKVLADKESDDLERSTAEMMIANYNDKLAKLALAQESIKGFPQGIPVIAMPYIIANDIDPAQFVPTQAQEEEPDANMGVSRFGGNIVAQLATKQFGGTDKDYFSPEAIEARKQTLPKKESYVKKGFSADAKKEEAFRSEKLNKPFYDVFKKAMEMPDSDPGKVNALSEAMSLLAQGQTTQPVTYSGYVPDILYGAKSLLKKTKESKVDDFIKILGEEKLRLTDPKKYEELYSPSVTRKKQTEEKLAKNIDLKNQVERIYAYYTSVLDSPDASASQKIEASNKLKEYEDLNPYYRERKVQADAIDMAQGLVFNIKDAAIPELYTEQERPKIEEDYKKVSQKWKAAEKKQDSFKTGKKEDPFKAEKEELENMGFDWTNPTQEQLDALSPKTYAYLEQLYNRPEYKGLKETLFEQAYGGSIYESGGVLLPKAQKGLTLKKKPKTNTAPSKSSIDLFPEEEEERQKWMASNPDSTVDEETYNKLVELYEKAKKADPTGTKKTKEAEEFQREYHKVLPQTAGQIIASAGKKTKKALKEGRTWWDLEGNVDAYFGPRTEKYFEALKKKKPTAEKTEEKAPADTTKKEETKAVDRGQIKKNTPINLGQGTYAPWWLQDIIGTAGAYGDLARIKRYQPWQATPQVYLPEMVPYDPTRELAANAEQANIAMQAQQAFTNPQQLAAASSVIQGKALANAADIMGRYNNLNVGLANQLEKERANLLNQASQQRSALDTQLWDKYTVANQQFDNSKALARQELRKNVINAVTNRAKTQAMNTLYPDYYTDPSTGGFVQFRPGYTPTPTTPSDNIDALWKKAKELNPNDPASIFKALYGKKDSDEQAALPYQGYPV